MQVLFIAYTKEVSPSRVDYTFRPFPSKYVHTPICNTQPQSTYTDITPVHYPHITLVHLLQLYPSPLTPQYLSQLTLTLPQSTNPTLAQSTYPHITLTHLPPVHYPHITLVNLPPHYPSPLSPHYLSPLNPTLPQST